MDDNEVIELTEGRPNGDIMYLSIYQAPRARQWRTVRMISYFDGGTSTVLEMWATKQSAKEYFDAMYSWFHGVEPAVTIDEKYFEEPMVDFDHAAEIRVEDGRWYYGDEEFDPAEYLDDEDEL